ncbi:hypothetical protein [Blautia producta]|uniref:hypothetical protein n=1 Tax=Blautia producta TaxID=33035 RepID=UPI00102367C1
MWKLLSKKNTTFSEFARIGDKEEEEFYKSELLSANSELQATWDLLKEFKNFLPQHPYLYEMLKNFM